MTIEAPAHLFVSALISISTGQLALADAGS